MNNPRLKPRELAPFIMTDEMATPEATEKALRAGKVAAERSGDLAEAKRIGSHLSQLGPTGLRYSHRPAGIDPIRDLIADRRLRHAAQVLRDCMESLETGRTIDIQAYEYPKDPEPDPDDQLPSIKHPPRVPDPKNRWTKAKRTLDVDGNKVDCPPTWPPKKVKQARGMPRQFIAEQIFAAIRKQEGADRRKVLWRQALDTFATWPMREAIWGIIIERRSLSWACRYTGLHVDGRHKRIVKQNLVAALQRVAHHLEKGDLTDVPQ